MKKEEEVQGGLGRLLIHTAMADWIFGIDFMADDLQSVSFFYELQSVYGTGLDRD